MLSILITHYNRPLALKKCIDTIKAINWNIDYEIIISDDASTEENIETIKTFDVDQLIIAPANQGLAANINKGLKACKGTYIIYCQDDFLIQEKILSIVKEIFNFLDEGNLEMIRLRANYTFPYLYKKSNTISEIPKFSWKNFHYNAFQYSDNPFITKLSFFEKYGYFLEKTSGDYGECEYAIRIFKSKARIGITNVNFIRDVEGSFSVIRTVKEKKISLLNIKKVKRFLRSVRLYLEYILYNSNKRGLLTYKNLRKKRV